MPMNDSARRKRPRDGYDYDIQQAANEPAEDDFVDFKTVWNQVEKHWKLLLGVILVCCVCSAAYTAFFIPRTYASSGTLFLTPKVVEGEVDISSLNSNEKLVDNVLNLMTQENIMVAVAHETGVDDSKTVREALKVENTPNTEIITVTATTDDAKLSKDIATNTINEFINTMQDSLNVQNIQVTNTPKLNYEPVGPSMIRNVAIGGLVGFVLDFIYIVYKIVTDKHLTTREDAEKFLGLPVYAQLPDLEK